MKTCFVVCPIGEENSTTRKRSDQLFEYIISPVCKELGFNVIRVDHIDRNDCINQTIMDYLTTAELVIADLTDHNPNAFFEMGYRSALKKPIVHIIEKGQTIPFDVTTIRTFEYDFNIATATKLKERLTNTISSLDFDESIEATSQDVNSEIPSVMLQMLYNIHDSIENLRNEIKYKDNSVVTTLANQIATQSQSSPDALMMQTVISKIFDNPQSLKALLDLTQQYKQC